MIQMKNEKVLVLVETISQFRMRYMVEVPADHPEYALDTVTMDEAVEFSQEHLGETIVSHREISEDDALKLCDNDNAYFSKQTRDKKISAFFTISEKNENTNQN